MHRLLAISVLVASVSACIGPPAAAQTAASLRTAQTTVQLKADAMVPHVVSLQATGQAPWLNQAAEDLIANAEVNGHSVPLQWKLVSDAGQADAKHVTFVYETHSPYLRLTWE